MVVCRLDPVAVCLLAQKGDFQPAQVVAYLSVRVVVYLMAQAVDYLLDRVAVYLMDPVAVCLTAQHHILATFLLGLYLSKN